LNSRLVRSSLRMHARTCGTKLPYRVLMRACATPRGSRVII
jgi:hypothetical protein